MQTIFEFTGTQPLLMHSPRFLDVKDPLVREYKLLAGKRGKTDEELANLSDLEFEIGLYYDESLGPYVPGMAILMCVQDGAKKLKRGRQVEEGVRVMGTKIPLLYDGPRDRDALKADSRFRDVRGVGMGQKRVQRTRPFFNTPWRVVAPFTVDDEVMNVDTLLRAATLAGLYSGLLDYRPFYGLFEVKHLESKPFEGL